MVTDRRPRRLPALLVCLAALPALAAGPQLPGLIPEDTDAVVLVQDLPALLAAWPKSPLARTWNDPQVKKFFAPLRESIKIDEWERLAEQKVGFPLSEILAAFDGQAMLVLPDLAAAVREEETGVPAPVGILAHVGNEEVARALAELEIEDEEAEGEAEGIRYEEQEEEFQGVTLHLERELDAEGTELSSNGWAISEGCLVVGTPVTYLRELVAAVKKGSVPSSWAQSGTFGKLGRRSGPFDVAVYLNFGPLVPMIFEEARKAQAEVEQPAPAAMNLEALIDSLALDTIEGVFVTARMGKGETRSDFVLTYGEDKGVVRLIAYEPPPVQLPAIIPPDVLEASVSNFSVTRFWGTLIGILERMNPMVATMLDMQREQSKAVVGFDPLDALISSLGDQLIRADFMPAAERPGEQPLLENAESLYGVAVADRQSLEMAVEGIKTLAGGGGELFEQRDYLGHTIHTFKMPLPRDEQTPGPEKFVSYAITDSYLLIGAGSSAPIESVLGRMRTPGKSLWQRADVKAALERLPEGASAVSYSDVAALIRGLFDLMARAQQMAGSEENGDEEGDDVAEPFCDPEARPDARTLERYFDIAVGGVYKEAGLLHVTSRLLHPGR